MMKIVRFAKAMSVCGMCFDFLREGDMLSLVGNIICPLSGFILLSTRIVYLLSGRGLRFLAKRQCNEKNGAG